MSRRSLSSPHSISSSVDLPAPFLPVMPICSPPETESANHGISKMEPSVAHIKVFRQKTKSTTNDRLFIKQQATQISTAKQVRYAVSILTDMTIHYLKNLNYLLLIAAPLPKLLELFYHKCSSPPRINLFQSPKREPSL